MDPHVELPRRQRLFRYAIVTLGALELLILTGPWLGWLTVPAAGLLMLALSVPAILLFTRGVRWVHAAQPRLELTPTQAAAVTHARTRFVRRYGMLGVGLPWALFMAGQRVWDRAPEHSLAVLTSAPALRVFGLALLVHVPAGLLAGYCWGRVMWRMFTPKTEVRAG